MRLLKTMSENERFNSTEQSIIKYILAHSKEISHFSIRDLSERTFSSPATIFRLCQKLNLKGYTDFKIKFISEINRTSDLGRPITGRPITDKNPPDSIVKKIAALEIEAIEETKNEMDTQQLIRIAEKINDAKCIDFYAFDQNYFIAQMTSYNLTQIKKTSIANLAANSQYMQALTCDKDNIAIILSRTGENKRLIDIANILKTRRITSLLLSPAKNSSLAKLTSEFLYVADTKEYLDMGLLIFNTGVRYYLDVIFAMLLSQNYWDIKKTYDNFEDIFGRLKDPWHLW
ncbi:MurR/RpiR family transcriptional regulator [Pectinatus brassicae]|uniref:DNA-binding MurR/RpiR family transcriptional regulator n=1 Tax=Pectinatus brassicae TaxID=862415 RepID=A0A840UGA8_9FIRM|nr:MurR/RpiR family transcriptional regulator [Pectinatus brassicae]MBB5335220.1 DNA-binding MurR/RpiR family transcriptional regulator [Pectinatus brassicae]